MKKRKFIRSKWRTQSKLGRGRKKLRKWRKPNGRDTKMRLQKKGNPPIVKIGYKKQKKEQKPVIKVYNLKDLEKVKDKEIILGRIGNRKKIEIVKKAKELKITIVNLSTKKFLKKLEEKKKVKKKLVKEKQDKEKKKQKADKKTEEKKAEEAKKKAEKKDKEETKLEDKVDVKAEVKKPEEKSEDKKWN